MDLKKIREEERRQENGQRKQKMVEAAARCFIRKGIEATSIVDIAREAGFGEATVYRYFSNKENLALACGIRFWDQVGDFFKERTASSGFAGKSGMEQVKDLMDGALEFYERETESFRLIHNLDGFLLSHKVDEAKLQEYSQAVDSLRPYLWDALEKGKADGSIQRREDTTELYYALTNGIFGMMQKQAAAGELLETDRTVDGIKKTRLLAELLVAGLKNREM